MQNGAFFSTIFVRRIEWGATECGGMADNRCFSGGGKYLLFQGIITTRKYESRFRNNKFEKARHDLVLIAV